MSVFQLFQILFAVLVVTAALRKTRQLTGSRMLDGAAFRRAFVRSLRDGGIEAGERLAERAAPAWLASLALAMLRHPEDATQRAFEAEEAFMDLQDAALSGMRLLRLGASIASALGFIGAAIEIRWIFTAEHGLMALQAGLVESVGVSAAALSIAIGVGTSSFALGAWFALKPYAKELIADARRLLSSGLEVLEPN